MDDYFGNAVGGYGQPSAPTWGSRPPATPPAPSYGGSSGGSTEQLPYAVSAPAYPPYPSQAFPPAYSPAPPSRSTGSKVLLGLAVAVGGFVVLVLLAAVVLPTFLDHGERGLVARTTVSIPETVGGTPRMYGGRAAPIEQGLGQVPGPGQHQIGVYGNGAVPSFAVVVSKAHLTAAQRRAYLAGVQQGGPELLKVDPGGMGGEMRCGPVGAGATVCAFIDPAVWGFVAVFDGGDAAATARAVRAAVEHRTA